MNTKRNWIQVAVVVVMAVARLSFTTPVAADLCGVPFVSEFDQYKAATEWAEKGGLVPEALTVSCVEDTSNLTASPADLIADSGMRWEQYSAAIGGRELSLDAAPVSAVTGGVDHFEQYSAAIEWAERGGAVPQALTVSGGENSPDLTASGADNGGDSGVRFEQYMAAIEGTAVELAPSAFSATGVSLEMFEQYQAAAEEHWEQFLTGTDRAPSAFRAAEEPLEMFEQYQAAAEEHWERYLTGTD